MASQKEFHLELSSFKTVNTKDSPITMKDDELPVLINYMPIGTSLYTVLGPSATLAQTPRGTTITRMWPANLNGSFVWLVFCSNGALYQFDDSWIRTTIAAAGTFANPRFEQWKYTTALIIDANGYFSYDGTNFINRSASIATVTIATPGVVTLAGHEYYAGQAIVFTTTGALPTGITAGTTYYVISSGLTANTFKFSATYGGAAVDTTGTQSGVHKITTGAPAAGTCIASFKGRVFTANGRTYTYSAPDSYSDFTVAAAGGAGIDNYPSLAVRINDLVATQEYLYVVGDHATHAITGVSVYSTGSTIFDLIDAVPGVGSLYPDAISLHADSIFEVGDTGINLVSAGSFQTISQYLDGVFPRILTSFNPVSCFVKIYNKLVYCVLVSMKSIVDESVQKWLLCFYEGRWFFVFYNLPLTFIAQKRIYNDTQTYGAHGNNIVQLFSTESTLKRSFRTKSSNYGDPIRDKQVLWVGITLSNIDGGIVASTGTVQVIGNGNPITSESGVATLNFAQLGIVWKNSLSQVVAWSNNSAMIAPWSKPYTDVLAMTTIEAMGKRLQIDFSEESDTQYIVSGIVVGGIYGADK